MIPNKEKAKGDSKRESKITPLLFQTNRLVHHALKLLFEPFKMCPSSTFPT